MTSAQRTSPHWWLGEGAERCPFCLQGYAVEVAMRCTRCDVPGCLHCVVEVRRTAGTLRSCPGCREPEAAGGAC